MSGLLTIIFMQFTLSFGAPLNVDYLTRLDWLFFACYIIQILIVAHSFFMYLIFVRISQEIAVLDKRKRRRQKMDAQVSQKYSVFFFKKIGEGSRMAHEREY